MIADNYSLWEDAEVGTHRLDEKIDFDLALESLSGRQRKVIEMYMKGYTDYELEKRGFYRIAGFRKSVFGLMAEFLNEGTSNVRNR